MKIKLDENLPFDLVSTLAGLGHDVHSVFAEGIIGARDVEVWKAAQREERFLITLARFSGRCIPPVAPTNRRTAVFRPFRG